jgi:hypothetical protein
MWHRINQAKRLFRVSFWRTLFFNFYMLPFKQALKLPIILPGVNVGYKSVIAAGAVVTKGIEPYTMVGGIPARIIKPLHK